MAYHARPNIVTDGLVFYIDAANKLSNTAVIEDARNIVNPSEEGDLVNTVINGDVFSFDGVDDEFIFGDIHNFERTDTFSWSVWVKPVYPITNGDGFYFLMSKTEGITTSTGVGILFNVSDKIGVSISALGSSNRIIVFGTNTIDDGEWHNLSFTYSGVNENASDITLYVDGDEDVISSNPINNLNGNTILTSNNLRIGGREPTESPLYGELNGEITCCAIYNKELTSDEVKKNYEAQKHRFE